MTIAAAVVSPSQGHKWAEAFARHLHRLFPAVSDRTCPWDVYRDALLHTWGLPVSGSLAPDPLDADTVTLHMDHLKGWAKQTQSRLRPGPPLNLCQTALAQALGASGWLALPGHLGMINVHREQRRAEIKDRASTDSVPPVRKGDWISDQGVAHPDLGKVRDCYYDTIAKEWVADVVLYSPDGDRIGRSSPRMDGPAGFEPCVSLRHWQRIGEPAFPLAIDRTGYRGWAAALVILPWRNAPASERQAAWARLLQEAELHELEGPSSQVQGWRKRYGNPDDPDAWWDVARVRPSIWDEREQRELQRRLADPEELAQAQAMQAASDEVELRQWAETERDRWLAASPQGSRRALRDHLKTYLTAKAWEMWALPDQTEPTWPEVTDALLAPIVAAIPGRHGGRRVP